MAASKDVIEVNDVTFDLEVLRSDRPVLVDFGAQWCGPCRSLAPILHELAGEAQGRFKVVTVDVDQSPAVAARYGIRSLPTVVAFVDGQKAAQHVGLTTRDKLLGLLPQADDRQRAS